MLRHVTWIMIFCLLSLSVYVQKSSFADNVLWTPAGNDIYLNEQTLTHISGAVHSLWIRIVPDKDSSLYTRSTQLLRDMGKDHAALDYVGYLTEIDCKTVRYREILTMFYRKDKNIIGSLHKEGSPWQEITGDSMITDVYRTVCSGFLAENWYDEPC